MKKKTYLIILSTLIALALASCSAVSSVTDSSSSVDLTNLSAEINTSDIFTDRDLEQEADTSEAETIEVKNGEDINITKEGTYIITGTAENVSIIVEAGDEDKVQLVLEGLTITNDSDPCIYVKSADKVFVTTSSDSELKVTGTFEADGDTNTDAVICAKDDRVLNGTSTLTINSTDNAVSCKDDLKITGGTYVISCEHSAIEANDSISISNGTLTITQCTDGLHSENDDDDTLGSITILNGTFSINATDDGIHATTGLTIDDGTFTINAAEGLEATQIVVNSGTLDITASDDGMNAAHKSDSLNPAIMINGGDITISMGAGDTDGIDSNGDLIINGGTVNITGQSAFDYDGNCEYNGGTLIVNGTETDTITNQFAGGFGGQGGPGDQGGDNPGFGGNPPSGKPGH